MHQGNFYILDARLRVCWNRQTGTFEGRVSYGVWVQVPSPAPVLKAASSDKQLFQIFGIKEKKINDFIKKVYANINVYAR